MAASYADMRPMSSPILVRRVVEFTATDVAALYRIGGRGPAPAADTLAALADRLSATAHSMLLRLSLDSEERRQRPALRALTRAAEALVARLEAGRGVGRQMTALRRRLDALPAFAVLALHDAAAGTDDLACGTARYQAALAAIAKPSDEYPLERTASTIAHWASAAAAARPPRLSARDSQSAPVRAFAVSSLEMLHGAIGTPPKLTRRTDTQQNPGAADGPDLRLLQALCDLLRQKTGARPETARLALLPALSPGPETLAEWIHTAQGSARRRRG